eukprot:TRINITY_DN518_c0_g1_i2.p1 TRINITY_DN518_c0_g1~~TRINITY_DN518_c0_g1_i2.p1  ORF type:complete len:297 (+),score=42.01 TRINITY_DN518_c0_g1_i2:832-1722(+)
MVMIVFLLQKTFHCPIDGCPKSYKLKYHLTIHMHTAHERKAFQCPKENCNVTLSSADNLKRHLKRHEQKGDSWKGQRAEPKSPPLLLCPEPGCEKNCKYPSKLAKHLEDVHRTSNAQYYLCCYPECLEFFPDCNSLKEHIQQKHSRVKCDICGKSILKKEMQRHKRTHEDRQTVEKLQCPFENCLRSYVNRSNLKVHIKAVHEGLRPFCCSYADCGAVFAYKHARDAHEKTLKHVYYDGDFEEEDDIFQSKPRGGRKLKVITVCSLLRKRVCGPNENSVFEDGFSYLDWLMTAPDS